MTTFNYVALETNQNNVIFSLVCNKFRDLLMPSCSTEEVNVFLTKDNPRFLCAILLYSNQRLAGFTTLGFYHKIFNEKEVVIARISTGVEKDLRGGTLPLELMWEKLEAYKRIIGDTPMYFAGYIANPLMYNAVCESIWEYYPRHSTDTPAEIKHLLKQLKSVYINLGDNENDFTFNAPFSVNIDEQVQHAINTSTNENVLYYRKLNPGYLKQRILIVIAPLTKENIKRSIEKVFARRGARTAA